MGWLDIDQTKPVKVYWNLHKQRYSVSQNNIVVWHAPFVELKDVTFHVQPAGNAKVRKEKRKNVHAYVKGTPYHLAAYFEAGEAGMVKYNPYKNKTFVMADSGEPIHQADFIWLDSGEADSNGKCDTKMTIWKKFC
jgi:hypothetical protein